MENNRFASWEEFNDIMKIGDRFRFATLSESSDIRVEYAGHVGVVVELRDRRGPVADIINKHTGELIFKGCDVTYVNNVRKLDYNVSMFK